MILLEEAKYRVVGPKYRTHSLLQNAAQTPLRPTVSSCSVFYLRFRNGYERKVVAKAQRAY